MQSKSRQLLSLVLAALVIMAPLGSPFAAALSSDDGAGDMGMHAMHQADTSALTADPMPAGCDHSTTTDCCPQGDCTSGFCGNCAMPIAVAFTASVLFPHVSYAPFESLTEFFRATGSPFRPPRA